MSAGALIAPPLRRLEASLPRSSCRVWAAERASPVQGVLCLEPPGAVSRGHAPCRGGARPGSGGAQGRCLVRPGLLADTAVDPLAEQFVAGSPDLAVRSPMQDGTTVALREVILHMVEEYARHLGHADLLRERIDGRVGQ